MALELINGNQSIFWHVGRSAAVTYKIAATIESVQADGDELGLIVDKFANLPMLRHDAQNPSNTARGYIMRWFGDDAKFIAGNLHLLTQ